MKKILILEANPHKELDLNKEIRDLEDVIQQSRDREQFQIKVCLAVRSDDLQQRILAFEAQEPQDSPMIIHFCGHGTGEQGLVFRDQKISTDALSNLLECFKNKVNCVVLNACYSEVQANEMIKHVKYVIGMKQAIQDKAALAFSIGFYRALGYGKSIENAFKFGCNSIQLAISESSKSREAIASTIRKLVPTDSVKETPITQEHLKPILKKDEQEAPDTVELETPEGKVSIKSKFYSQREIEEKAYQALEKKGEFIRIKSPKQMGKTSLVDRLLDYAKQEYKYEAVNIEFSGANKKFFANIDELLKWIYRIINQELSIEFNEEDWDESTNSFGSNYTWISYVKKYILEENRTLVLAIDDFERVFQHPQIAQDFCGLLRSMYKDDKCNNLILIIAYSQESYVDEGITNSPLSNVGISIELSEFNLLQVKTLVELHQLDWDDSKIEQLMAMVGGHPYLIRVALYNIVKQKISLDELLETSSQIKGCYFHHLNSLQEVLKREPTMASALKKVISSNKPVRLQDSEIFQLYMMGLIVPVDNNEVKIRCHLYQKYFKDRLNN